MRAKDATEEPPDVEGHSFDAMDAKDARRPRWTPRPQWTPWTSTTEVAIPGFARGGHGRPASI